MSTRYEPSVIEPKWQKKWEESKCFETRVDFSKPKYYALIEFPYPSGQGLHVGHARPYTALDIIARMRRMQGYNVLFPMGYDSFGLPTENYAIKTGIKPQIVAKDNIARFRKQLKTLGYSFDWSRELSTCDPSYYKWTQWIFLKLYEKGLAYKAEMPINFCTSCKVGLANEEVVDGVCDRCGSPVIQKVRSQWMLRITDYAQRLIDDIKDLDFISTVKTQQINWIGRSEGAEVVFSVENADKNIKVFTTRPDTIFGATYMVISPEHPLIDEFADRIDNMDEITEYRQLAKKKSDFERSELAKDKTGVEISGMRAINPATGKSIPIWISDYVLSGYGSGAVMAVPAHDSRDFAFARKFNLPIVQVVVPNGEEPSEPSLWQESKDSKSGVIINSDFLDGLEVKQAIRQAIHHIEQMKIGFGTTNYRLRDAIFSRQRYWGEPFPIYYKDEIPYPLKESELPLSLPEVDKYLPTENGDAPLARAKNWATKEGYRYDYNTMPGFAGSNAYSIRYMDPHNNLEFVSKEANSYWQNVDLYVGGSEHATGHLLYSRFICKFLFDIGVVCSDEPYKKLINQGMIQGKSQFVYRIKGTNKYVSLNLKDKYETDPIHVDINMVDNDVLDVEKFRKWRPEFADAEFELEEGKYICGSEVEKMSKSLFNVQNPDDLVEKYGADTLRLYEMFLGPIEQSKPWDTKGIEGVSRFVRKFWLLSHKEDQLDISEEPATKEELKILHKTIKKVQDDIERFSLNTSVSTFMICVNELGALKCNKRAIIEPLTIILSPFAPHICEEIWQQLGHSESISYAKFPQFDPSVLVESSFKYPVSINGKTRTYIEFALDAPREQIEKEAVENSEIQKFLEGKAVKKIIYVPKKIINIVA